MSNMLTFRYGVVGSSKSANLLMQNHDFKLKNKNVLLLKSSLDTRDEAVIRSRVGLEANATIFSKEDSLKELISREIKKDKVDIILVDEAQFLTTKQVKELALISNKIEIFCYGLMTTYLGTLFEGSSALVVYSDNLEEIPSICKWCNKKATMSLRIVDEVPVYSGDTIQIGDIKEAKEYYVPCCRNHYFLPKLQNKK